MSAASRASDQPLLAARGICAGYGGGDILRHVDLEVVRGLATAVIGANGSGKSTLVRSLAGVLPLRAGTVELLGRPLTAWRRREAARHIGVVPQLVEFTFPLSVREVVAQGRSPHLGPWSPPSRHDRAAVDDALTRVGLGGCADVSVRELSGGQRQLVLLARALATEPSVLVMDEPAAALDVRHQLDLVATLRRQLATGVGALLVLHDWNLALRVAGRAVVLRDGAVIAAGPLPELFRPSLFAEAFGVQVQLVQGPDGHPVVVPAG